MALATAILVVSLFTRDTMEQLIDATYFLADRQERHHWLCREADR
jgi:putative ABC transport system permease protein